jgi:hypothetical protein
LILGIVGKNKLKNANLPSGRATAGIVLNAIYFGILAIILVVIVLFFGSLLAIGASSS